MNDDLLTRLADAGADVTAPADLEDRAAARYRVHTRRRRAAAGAGVAVALALGTVAVPTVLDALRPAEAPVIGEGDALPTAPSTPLPTEDVPPAPMPTVGDVEAIHTGDGGSWRPIPPLPASAAERVVTSSWAGDRLLVATTDTEFGGRPVQLYALDAAATRWTTIDTPRVDGREWSHTLWTGTELVLLGGPVLEEPDPDIAPSPPTVAGLAYAPATDTWRTIDPAPLSPRFATSAVWTGSEVVVWGGLEPPTTDADGITRQPGLADGAAWSPATGTWRAIAAAPLAGRGEHGAVWNGRRMVVFAGGSAAGGYESEAFLTEERDDAAVYDPATDTWATIPGPGVAGGLAATVWTGTEVVAWTGRLDDHDGATTGVVWDPATGTTRALPHPPFPQQRDVVEALWAPELGEVVLFGGSCGEGCNRAWEDGARFDPATDTWTALEPGGTTGFAPAVAWSGTRLLVVGGSLDPLGAEGPALGGGRWTPGAG
jgi:hypothetical protein